MAMIDFMMSGTIILLFILSLISKTPKKSLSLSYIGFLVVGIYFVNNISGLMGTMFISLSVILLLAFAFQNIMYFDLEKEFQQQYKKDVTTVVSTIFACIIFGFLIIQLAIKNMFTLELSSFESMMNALELDISAHYVFMMSATGLVGIVVIGICLINKERD